MSLVISEAKSTLLKGYLDKVPQTSRLYAMAGVASMIFSAAMLYHPGVIALRGAGLLVTAAFTLSTARSERYTKKELAVSLIFVGVVGGACLMGSPVSAGFSSAYWALSYGLYRTQVSVIREVVAGEVPWIWKRNPKELSDAYAISGVELDWKHSSSLEMLGQMEYVKNRCFRANSCFRFFFNFSDFTKTEISAVYHATAFDTIMGKLTSDIAAVLQAGQLNTIFLPQASEAVDPIVYPRESREVLEGYLQGEGANDLKARISHLLDLLPGDKDPRRLEDACRIWNVSFDGEVFEQEENLQKLKEELFSGKNMGVQGFFSMEESVVEELSTSKQLPQKVVLAALEWIRYVRLCHRVAARTIVLEMPGKIAEAKRALEVPATLVDFSTGGVPASDAFSTGGDESLFTTG